MTREHQSSFLEIFLFSIIYNIIYFSGEEKCIALPIKLISSNHGGVLLKLLF